MSARLVGLLLVVAAAVASPNQVHAQAKAPAQPRKHTKKRGARHAVVLDRAVVRFTAPEIGGARNPQFIFARVLAFEARLEALADPQFTARGGLAYRERHVRSAMERHIAETLLAQLRITPEPKQGELSRRTRAAWLALSERVNGEKKLLAAAAAEGIDRGEVLRLVRRQARASFYLDRMVAPMLAPSEAELKAIHRAVPNPYSKYDYPRVKAAMRRWYVSRRLQAALQTFFQNARSRLAVKLL